MIRTYTILLLLLFTQFGFAQVGIGTTDPTPGYALDVKGSLLVQDEFKITEFTNTAITSNNSKFLVRRSNSTPLGEVAILDLSKMTVGPVNIANYSFAAPQNSGLIDVDLQFDADKYIVGIADFRYTGTGTAVLKGGGLFRQIGNFRTRSYIVDEPGGRTWHIQIGNPNLTSGIGSGITYYLTVIIYDRNYFKELPLITADLDNKRAGSAPAPMILQ